MAWRAETLLEPVNLSVVKAYLRQGEDDLGFK